MKLNNNLKKAIINQDGELAVCSFLNQCGGIDEKTGEEQVGFVALRLIKNVTAYG
ncbi:MAG: hypothetical protein R3271_05540 [Methylophaga sp.]|uniref:hypothetical protein n=1 Tax=Methylophaga sp. TaxID=2024840 RepID=UPI00299F1125|nr:hypothetical protein [Methylophaga sp.]MDX1749766.1 hypothetical protein [Methylophaga sp.]